MMSQTKTPRIDPLRLLTCLSILLAPNGGILSTNEVKRLAGLMAKFSKKLVSKCIYIQILKCTETDLLGQFMAAGGWSLTHMWLTDCIMNKNWPLVQEILELLLLCPVDVARLKSNTAPKLVKGLSKEGSHEGVRILATRLVEQWLKIVKGETAGIEMGAPLSNQIGDTTQSLQDGHDDCSEENTIEEKFSETLTEAPATDSSAQSFDSLLKNTNIMFIKSETDEETNDGISIDSACDSLMDTTKQIIPTKIGDTIIKPISKSVTSANKLSNQGVIKTMNIGGKATETLVFKFTVKDGKQILAKVEPTKKKTALGGGGADSSAVADGKVDVLDENDETNNSISNSSNSNSNTISKTHVSKDKENKEIRDDGSVNSSTELKEKQTSATEKSSKSSSSRDKDKHQEREKSRDRDRKSSSSNHRSSGSSSKSSSSRSHHSSSKSSSSSHKSSSTSSSRDKDKKSGSSSKSSSSSSSRDKDRDRHKDRDKNKVSQAEKDKDTLAKVMSGGTSLEKLGKIPRKPKDDGEAKGAPVLPNARKSSMSIEVRKDNESRPKTAKQFNSQFRSHGLAEEAPPPPSRKLLKKPGTAAAQTSPNSISNSLKRSSPPPVAASSTIMPADLAKEYAELSPQPPEKKLRADITVMSIPESIGKPGGIKLIPAKPKPVLVESDMFMDALSASATTKKDVRKRKRRPSSTSGGASPPESPARSTSPRATAPLKFYTDTLEKNEEYSSRDDLPTEGELNSKESSENVDDDECEGGKRLKADTSEPNSSEEREPSNSDDEKCGTKADRVKELAFESEADELRTRTPGPGCGPDGPPGVLMLHRRRGPKKQLRWRPPEALEEVRFFELDETERVNVTKTFTDMKQMERCGEREAFLMARKMPSEDTMMEQTIWMPLIEMEDVPVHPAGAQSNERNIQIDREKTVLKALYFGRHMIPDCPAEPDMEHYQITDPQPIPLNDITENPDAINDFTNMPWPDPRGSPPHIPSNLGMPNVGLPFGGAGPFGPPFMTPFGVNGPSQSPWQMGGLGGVGPGGQFPGPLGPDDIAMVNTMGYGLPGSFNNGFQIGGNMGGGGGGGSGGGGGGGGGSGGSGGSGRNRGGQMQQNNGGNWYRQGFSSGGGSGSGNGGSGSGSGQSGWRSSHGHSSRNWMQSGGRRGVCKQFEQKGFCRQGDKCNYFHPPSKNSFN